MPPGYDSRPISFAEMELLFKEVFDLAGSLICHQLPERSLMAGNMVLPVCARDTGLYAGVLTAFAYLAITRRLDAQRPPGLAAAVAMTVLMAPMVFDGALSYGPDRTNNSKTVHRLVFGMPIPYCSHLSPILTQRGRMTACTGKMDEMMIV